MLGGRQVTSRKRSSRAGISHEGLVFSKRKAVVPTNHFFTADQSAVFQQRNFDFIVGKQFARNNSFEHRIRLSSGRHFRLNPILKNVEEFLSRLLTFEPLRRITPGLKDCVSTERDRKSVV